MNVTVARVLSFAAAQQRLALEHDTGISQKIDLRGVVEIAPEMIQSTFTWERSGRNVVPRLRPLDLHVVALLGF